MSGGNEYLNRLKVPLVRQTTGWTHPQSDHHAMRQQPQQIPILPHLLNIMH